MIIRKPVILLLLASLLPFLAFAETEDSLPENVVAPKPKSSLKTQIPQELKQLLIERPYVDYMVLIGDDGELKDSLAIKSNHYGLLEAGDSVISKAQFSPAMQDDKAIPFQIRLRVSFEDLEQAQWQATGQIPMGSSSMGGTDRRIYKQNKAKFEYKESKVSELDARLQTVAGALVVVKDAEGNNAKGACAVEFYIDASGFVKLPKILKSDNEAVSMSALATLEKLQFAPPTHEGAPTYVKVRQKFSYTGEEDA